jgi:hypothetical protein
MRRARAGNARCIPTTLSEVVMELVLFLVVVFLVFLVAGWGWRRGRSGV